MLSKKQIKLIRKNIKLFSDSTQNTFKKEYYCLYVEYTDNTNNKYCYKRLKTALKHLDTIIEYDLYTAKVKEIYFTLQSINNLFEIVLYDGKLEIL
jgi:hypothetical protein